MHHKSPGRTTVPKTVIDRQSVEKRLRNMCILVSNDFQIPQHFYVVDLYLVTVDIQSQYFLWSPTVADVQGVDCQGQTGQSESIK
jgi:hypothetical protein